MNRDLRSLGFHGHKAAYELRRSALTRSTRSSERSGRSRSAAMTSRRSRTTTPTPPSRIVDLCGSWICCSRFFPGGCPRIGTRDSRRFGSAWVWHGLRFAGHGETGLRCGASRTWDYASERSEAKSHVRMPPRRHTRLLSIPVLPIGIMLRNVPQRNPTCGCPIQPNPTFHVRMKNPRISWGFA